MEALDQGDGHRKGERNCITTEILMGLLNGLPMVCSAIVEAFLFKAAFVVAFFGAFRVTVPQASTDRSRWAVAIGAVLLHLRFSETDQYGNGALMVWKCADKCLCPIRAVKAFLAIWNQEPGPTVFTWDGSFLTRYQFTVVMRKALACCSLIPG